MIHNSIGIVKIIGYIEISFFFNIEVFINPLLLIIVFLANVDHKLRLVVTNI